MSRRGLLAALIVLLATPIVAFSSTHAHASSGETFTLKVSGCAQNTAMKTGIHGTIPAGGCVARSCQTTAKYLNDGSVLYVQMIQKTKGCLQEYSMKVYNYDDKAYRYGTDATTNQTLQHMYDGGLCGDYPKPRGNQVVYIIWYLCVDTTASKCVHAQDNGVGTHCQ